MGLNAISMSSAVSSNCTYIDPEHQRIIRALMAYGVEPTGDKNTDKAKLQKIENEKSAEKTKMQKLGGNPEKESTPSQQASTDVSNGAGSDQIAMLNKLRFGLL